MSGDDSNKKKKSSKAKDEPVIPGTGPMMTQPAFMGDNQNLLAQQLAAGGYGSMPDIMQMLTQTFTPMQVLDTRPGATPAPAPPPAPQDNAPYWWNAKKWGEYPSSGISLGGARSNR